MSDEDQGFLILLLIVGVLGMLLGAGSALNDGMSAGRVIGHALMGFATGVAMILALIILAPKT
jgi:hypothetical protein